MPSLFQKKWGERCWDWLCVDKMAAGPAVRWLPQGQGDRELWDHRTSAASQVTHSTRHLLTSATPVSAPEKIHVA